MNIIVANNYSDLSQIASDFIVQLLQKKNNAVLGLATGSTPIGLYQKLIEAYNRGIISFNKVRSVNLDEYVGLDAKNDQSYAYFMRKNLFDHIDILPENTFIPNGVAKNLEKECINYSNLIKANRQDIQILGLGTNGHIGFNEPFTTFDSKTRVVDLTDNTIKDNARFFDSPKSVPTQAITMGISEIMSAKRIILLASGLNKAQAVFDAINGALDTKCPASILRKHLNCTFILDRESASML